MASASASNNERTSTSGTVTVKVDIGGFILELYGVEHKIKHFACERVFFPEPIKNPLPHFCETRETISLTSKMFYFMVYPVFYLYEKV